MWLICNCELFFVLRWLQFCHENFDEDYEFSSRDSALEVPGEGKSLFTVMKVGTGSQQISFKKTEKVKIKVDKKLTPVEIIGFEVQKALPIAQVLR
jgi:hypothetical protein